MRRTRLRYIAGFACVTIMIVLGIKLSSQSRRLNSDDILRLASVAANAKVTYGESQQQFAELRLPEGKGPFPVVVLIHGGCWIQYADTTYTAPLSSALVREGWAT